MKILRTALVALGVLYGLRLYTAWVRGLLEEPVDARSTPRRSDAPTTLDLELCGPVRNWSHGYVPALHVVRD